MQENSAQVFNQNWNVYEKIMRLNYMHHAEFANKTAGIFKTHSHKKNTVLDIGCGDAASISPILANAGIASYTGYDLSHAALQLAIENLSKHSFAFELKEGNMFHLMQQEKNNYDIIYTSFAIHHLQDDEKKVMLELCFRHLANDGVMIYTDVFRQKKYSRQEYLDDYFSSIHDNWKLISNDEKQLIIDHVKAYDFPSGYDETKNWLHVAGFNIHSSFQPDHLHAMIIAVKA